METVLPPLQRQTQRRDHPVRLRHISQGREGGLSLKKTTARFNKTRPGDLNPPRSILRVVRVLSSYFASRPLKKTSPLGDEKLSVAID